MAPTTTVYIKSPAAATAMGIYLFGKDHPTVPEGGGGLGASVNSFVGKVKKEVKSAEILKLAPQFDGLFSFETII